MHVLTAGIATPEKGLLALAGWLSHRMVMVLSSISNASYTNLNPVDGTAFPPPSAM
jgi:hypothetical protein